MKNYVIIGSNAVGNSEANNNIANKYLLEKLRTGGYHFCGGVGREAGGDIEPIKAVSIGDDFSIGKWTQSKVLSSIMYLAKELQQEYLLIVADGTAYKLPMYGDAWPVNLGAWQAVMPGGAAGRYGTPELLDVKAGGSAYTRVGTTFYIVVAPGTAPAVPCRHQRYCDHYSRFNDAGIEAGAPKARNYQY
jgi:hypothetical protein